MFIQTAIFLLLFTLGGFTGAATAPSLRQGMSLSESRTQIAQSGFQLPEYNKACLTHAQTLLQDNLQQATFCGMWQLAFLQEFVEYAGAAASSTTIWGAYRDGYGGCLTVGYGYDEEYINDPDPRRLLAGLRVVTWKKCEVFDSTPGHGTEERIPLKVDGGVFTAPISINGVITLDFIIDSGAAEVQIPADVVMTLLRAGTISREDFLEGQTYVLADGSSVKGERFIVRKMQIGNYVVSNVPAGISKLGSPLLLGQSFLRAFETWRVDNKSGHLVIGGSNDTSSRKSAPSINGIPQKNANSSAQGASNISGWVSDWGSGIIAYVFDAPCKVDEFAALGFDKAIISTIPIQRLKSQSQAWFTTDDRATTVIGCWNSVDGINLKSKLRRKSDGKTWDQELKLDDGSWRLF